MKRSIIFLFAFALVLTACQKDKLPVEPASDPVFYVSGKVNGIKVGLKAGDNNYFMRASFEQDKNGIYTFRGDLDQDCSSDCGYGLAVLLTDSRVSPSGAASDIDSVLHTGSYALGNQKFWPTEQELSFVPLQPFSGTSNNYTWTIADESGTIKTVSTYSFTQKLNIGKEYQVTLSFDDGSGSCPLRVHSNKYRPGAAFRAWMNSKAVGASQEFTAVTDKPGNYTYKWDFGDGTQGEGITASHTYSTNDVFDVKLTVTNDKNETCIYSYQFNNSASGCDANFKTLFAPIDFSQVFRNITFLLKDPSGKIYSSAEADQAAGREVIISEVSPYERNNKGLLTKKVKMTFSCDLKDDAGKTVSLTECEAVMAVAYP